VHSGWAAVHSKRTAARSPAHPRVPSVPPRRSHLLLQHSSDLHLIRHRGAVFHHRGGLRLFRNLRLELRVVVANVRLRGRFDFDFFRPRVRRRVEEHGKREGVGCSARTLCLNPSRCCLRAFSLSWVNALSQKSQKKRGLRGRKREKGGGRSAIFSAAAETGTGSRTSSRFRVRWNAETRLTLLTRGPAVACVRFAFHKGDNPDHPGVVTREPAWRTLLWHGCVRG